MPRVPVIYVDRDSPVHRRDARVKILTFVALVLFLYVAPTWQWMLALVVLGLGLDWLAQLSKRWVIVLWLLQLPNIIALLVEPALWQGSLTSESAFGIKLALAWSAALFVSIGLLQSMSVDEITDGLRGLRVPETVCFTVGYVFLLVYLSLNDIFRISEAMRVKGLELEPKKPIRSLVNLPKLMVPTIVTVIRRATTMMAVLQLRGFSATKRRAPRTPPKFDSGDALFLGSACAILALAASARLGWLPLWT